MAKSQRLGRQIGKFQVKPSDAPIVPLVEGVDFTPYQEWSMQSLGFKFNNPSLLVTALTHRSYVNEHRDLVKAHNERLEFLGDAVLELVSTTFLFKHFDLPEGILTSWRASLVRTESIRDAGEALGYATLVRMSKGEQNGSEHAKRHIVANCFEALIGAVYLDHGLDEASKIIHKYITNNTEHMIRTGIWRDPKSHLQEISQRIDGVIPRYKLVSESGPEHDKLFRVAVFIGEKQMGEGEGGTKRLAQEQAAEQAIALYESSTSLANDK